MSLKAFYSSRAHRGQRQYFMQRGIEARDLRVKPRVRDFLRGLIAPETGFDNMLPLTLYQPAQIPGYGGITTIHMTMAAPSAGAGLIRDDLRPLADKLFSIIVDDRKRTFSFQEIVDEHNRRHEAQIKRKELSLLNITTCGKALELLRERARVDIIGDDNVTYFDQRKRITGVTERIAEKLRDPLTLHQVMGVVLEESQVLRERVDLYLYDKGSDSLLRVTAGEPGYRSTYEEWCKVEEDGIFQAMLNRHALNAVGGVEEGDGGKFAYFPDIAKQAETYPGGPIFLKDRTKYQEAYAAPAQIRFSSPRTEGDETVLATKRHTWEPRGSGRRARELLSPNNGRQELHAAYGSLDQIIATAIGKVLGLPQNTGKPLRRVWEEEVEKIAKEEARGLAAAREEAAHTPLFEIVAKYAARESHFGETLVAVNVQPQSLQPAEREKLVRELNFEGRDIEDMEDHVLRVEELAILFYRDEDKLIPIAFASGQEDLFEYDGRKEKLAYLRGSMVKSGYRGRGLQTVTHGMYLFKRWRMWKINAGYGAPFRPMMRTRSVAASAGFFKRFSQVVAGQDRMYLEGANLARAQQFTRALGKECNDTGVVYGAYEEKVFDEERDDEVLRNLSRRKKRKIVTAVSQIGDLDARVHQGKWGLLGVLSAGFYIHVVFRLKNRLWYEWLKPVLANLVESAHQK